MTIKNDLAAKYQEIDTTLKMFSASQTGSGTFILLEKQFQQLIDLKQQHENELDEQDIIAIEDKKLAIINAIFLQLNRNSMPKKRKNELLPNKLEKLFSYPYAVIGSFLAGVGGYIGMNAILNLVLNTANPLALGLAIGTGIFEGCLFAFRDVRFLKKSIGVNFFKVKPLIEIYKKEAALLKTIPKLLVSHSYQSSMSSDEYYGHYRLLKRFHSDLTTKNAVLKASFKESPIRKLSKVVANTIDGFLCTSSGFFLGKCVIGIFAAAFAATPIGLAICAGAALFALGTFLLLRKSTISSTIDKFVGEPKKLIINQNQLLDNQTGLNSKLQQLKNIIQSKKTLEFEKQKLNAKIIELERKAHQCDQLSNDYNQKCVENSELNLKLNSLEEKVSYLVAIPSKKVEEPQSPIEDKSIISIPANIGQKPCNDGVQSPILTAQIERQVNQKTYDPNLREAGVNVVQTKKISKEKKHVLNYSKVKHNLFFKHKKVNDEKIQTRKVGNGSFII